MSSLKMNLTTLFLLISWTFFSILPGALSQVGIRLVDPEDVNTLYADDSAQIICEPEDGQTCEKVGLAVRIDGEVLIVGCITSTGVADSFQDSGNGVNLTVPSELSGCTSNCILQAYLFDVGPVKGTTRDIACALQRQDGSEDFSNWINMPVQLRSSPMSVDALVSPENLYLEEQASITCRAVGANPDPAFRYELHYPTGEVRLLGNAPSGTTIDFIIHANMSGSDVVCIDETHGARSDVRETFIFSVNLSNFYTAPHTLTMTVEPSVIFHADVVSIECNSQGGSPPTTSFTYKWASDSAILATGDSGINLTLREEHNGKEFSCQDATHVNFRGGAPTAVTHTSKIFTVLFLEVKQPIKDIELDPRFIYQLTCSSRTNIPPNNLNYKWFHNGARILNETKFINFSAQISEINNEYVVLDEDDHYMCEILVGKFNQTRAWNVKWTLKNVADKAEGATSDTSTILKNKWLFYCVIAAIMLAGLVQIILIITRCRWETGDQD